MAKSISESFNEARREILLDNDDDVGNIDDYLHTCFTNENVPAQSATASPSSYVRTPTAPRVVHATKKGYPPIGVDGTYSERRVYMSHHQERLFNTWYNQDDWSSFPSILRPKLKKFLTDVVPDEDQRVIYGK